MLRVSRNIFRRANDDQARRRRPRRCVPSLPESSSCLEDRVLLSAAGGKAHTAEVARNPADTKAGKEVTNLFESILQTSPTGAQLARMVHELRGGLTVKALRQELSVEATARGGTPAPAPMNVVFTNGDPAAHAMTSTAATAAAAINTASMMAGLSAPSLANVSPIDVSQVPAGMHISRSFSPTSGPTSISTSSGTPVTSTPTTMSPTSTMTGMGTMTGMSTSASSSMSPTPTASAALGTPSMLPVSPLPVSPLPVSPLSFTPLPIANM